MLRPLRCTDAHEGADSPALSETHLKNVVSGG